MKIHIPQPCAENWSEMNPTEKGRFCAVCQKEVIDFSKFTDEELKNFLGKSQVSTCGSFRPDQLERTLVARQPYYTLPTTQWWWSFLVLLGADIISQLLV